MAKKKKMADLLLFFSFYVNNLTLFFEKFFTYSPQICYVCYL